MSFSHVRRLALAAVVAGASLSVARAEPNAHSPVGSASDLLEQAFFLEQTLGAWDAAAELYRQVSLDPRANEDLKALANERLEARLDAPLALRHYTAAGDEKPTAAGDSKLAETIGAAAEAIQDAYAYEIKDEQLLQGALEGMLAKLDGEASYLSAADVREMTQGIDQQLVGVGLQLKFEGGLVVVVAPVPGSPGEKAGIVAGDLIAGVGDVKLADVAEDQRLVTAVRMIRGAAGQKVKLSVEPLKGEPKTIEIERAAIELESIRGDKREGGAWQAMVDPENKIGYLRILQFGRRTAEELRTALDKLKGEGMKGLVLDLRSNPGGALEPAVEAADLFLKGGEIVSIRGKAEKVTKFDAKAEGTLDDFPIAVIVNRNTASGAEILAAALQDHNRATIVGERSYGRGIVQAIVPLESTGGAIKLTTAVYTRPSGKPLKRERVDGQPKPGDDAGGVTPNEGNAVELSDDELRKYHEYRQERDFPTPGVSGEIEYTDRVLEKALAAVREKLGA